jgi:hypothetical protein
MEAGQPVPVPLSEPGRNDQLRHLLPDDLIPLVTEGLLGGRIELEDVAFVIDGDDAVEGAPDDGGLPGLAFPEVLLGLLALHELADLASDDRQGQKQMLVRFLDLTAEKLEDAEHLLPQHDRKATCPVDPFTTRVRCPGKIVVFRHVRDPGRSAGRPDPAGEADTGGEEPLASSSFEFGDRHPGIAPYVDAPENPGFGIDPPHRPDLPSEALTYSLEDHRSGIRDRGGIGQSAGDRSTRREMPLAAGALRDVHGDSDDPEDAFVGPTDWREGSVGEDATTFLAQDEDVALPGLAGQHGRLNVARLRPVV